MELLLARSPAALLRDNPELFAIEALTYAACAAGWIHARRSSPAHALYWAIAFTAASVVDPFCLLSPQLRNYYHSPASVLMLDRHVAPWQFPLFACIAYVPGAVVWALRLKSAVAEAALVAVVASWTFYTADMYACRYLIYQWDQTDPLYTARTSCVPLASSMWVMTYALTASALARACEAYVAKKQIGWDDKWTWWGLFFVATLAFLPLHIVPISIFYFPAFYFAGKEHEAVWFFWALCLAVGLVGSRFLTARVSDASDADSPSTTSFAFHEASTRKWAVAQSVAWFGGLALAGAALDPGNVVSTCLHQPYGGSRPNPKCAEKQTYLFGLSERPTYICDQDMVYWSVVPDPVSGKPAQPGDEWYTIKGKPMDPTYRFEYFGSLAVGVAMHALLLLLSSSSSSSASGASHKNKKKKQ